MLTTVNKYIQTQNVSYSWTNVLLK